MRSRPVRWEQIRLCLVLFFLSVFFINFISFTFFYQHFSHRFHLHHHSHHFNVFFLIFAHPLFSFIHHPAFSTFILIPIHPYPSLSIPIHPYPSLSIPIHPSSILIQLHPSTGQPRRPVQTVASQGGQQGFEPSGIQKAAPGVERGRGVGRVGGRTSRHCCL